MRGTIVAKLLLGASFCLLAPVLTVNAKLAPERWMRVTEEERHQLTRAERYFDHKEYKSALAEYELFLQLYGKSEVASYAQLMFAECTRRLGQVNTAINEFRNVIDYFPDSIDAGTAQYSIGVCLVQGGDAGPAVDAFEKVIAKWPKEDFGALARNEACTIYWRLGQTDKWLSHMQYLATGDYKDTQGIRMPSKRRFLMHLLVNNQLDDAFALIDPARKKDALLVFADWSSDAMRPQNIPALYGDKGKKALPSIATNVIAFITKQSSSVTDAGLKLSLDQRCARILASAGLTDDASARYAALLKKNPDNDSIRSEYAAHLRANEKYEDARLVYHEMKDQFAGDREIAETYGEENNWKRCIESYQAMLGKYPDKTSAIQWRLAEVLQQTGKYQEAMAAYQQSDHDPAALLRTAECQASLKQYDGAIQTLIGVVNFFKDTAPEAQYRIAGYQAAKGDKDAAIRTLKTVCKVYLSTAWAGRAHQDLSLKYGVDVTLGGAAKKDDK